MELFKQFILMNGNSSYFWCHSTESCQMSMNWSVNQNNDHFFHSRISLSRSTFWAQFQSSSNVLEFIFQQTAICLFDVINSRWIAVKFAEFFLNTIICALFEWIIRFAYNMHQNWANISLETMEITCFKPRRQSINLGYVYNCYDFICMCAYAHFRRRMWKNKWINQSNCFACV